MMTPSRHPGILTPRAPRGSTFLGAHGSPAEVVRVEAERLLDREVHQVVLREGRVRRRGPPFGVLVGLHVVGAAAHRQVVSRCAATVAFLLLFARHTHFSGVFGLPRRRTVFNPSYDVEDPARRDGGLPLRRLTAGAGGGLLPFSPMRSERRGLSPLSPVGAARQ